MLARMATIMRTWSRKAQGFSLIELVMVCTVTALLGGAILGIYEGLVRSWADTSHRIINQDDARLALDEVSRLLRMAESSESNLSSTSDAVAVAADNQLVFYSDIDGDGLAEKVRYYLDGTSLRMATVDPNTSTTPPTYSSTYTGDGVIIMNGIQNYSDANSANWTPMFTYYKMNPAYATNPVPANDTLIAISLTTSTHQQVASTDLSGIVAVEIKLAVNETPGVPKASFVLDTLIQIRQRYNGGLSGN
jgi:Tfp pilus assembly protein PilW